MSATTAPSASPVATFGQKVEAWMKQPTTIHGLAVAATAVSAALTGAISGSTLDYALLGAAILIVLPDNTQAASVAALLEQGVPQPK